MPGNKLVPLMLAYVAKVLFNVSTKSSSKVESPTCFASLSTLSIASEPVIGCQQTAYILILTPCTSRTEADESKGTIARFDQLL